MKYPISSKAVLMEKFRAINAYIKNEARSQISNLVFCLKELERGQTKPKVSKRKEITKIRAEINDKKLKNIKNQ